MQTLYSTGKSFIDWSEADAFPNTPIQGKIKNRLLFTELLTVCVSAGCILLTSRNITIGIEALCQNGYSGALKVCQFTLPLLLGGIIRANYLRIDPPDFSPRILKRLLIPSFSTFFSFYNIYQLSGNRAITATLAYFISSKICQNIVNQTLTQLKSRLV